MVWVPQWCLLAFNIQRAFKKQIVEETNRKVIFNIATLQRQKLSHDWIIIIKGLYYDLCIGVQVVAIL